MMQAAESFQSEASDISVGGCRVKPSQNLIEFDRQSTKISPRAMDTLAYLAAHSGEVVSGAELIDAVWKNRVVNDAQVYKIVSQLRRAFSDLAGGTPFIETVPKRGYRLVATVAPADSTVRDSASRLSRIWPSGKLGYAASGALILVIAGGSIEASKRLRGSAASQASGDPPGIAMGSQPELFAGQQRIEEPPTDSPEAYTLYLRAGQTALMPGLPNSIRHLYLDEALALDPAFAQAHARKADVYALGLVDNFSSGSADSADLDAIDSLARGHAEKALTLKPDLGSAYVALGRLNMYRWRWGDAREAYERAFELNSTDLDLLRAYALLSAHSGENAKAISLATRGTELAPTHPALRFRLGTVQLYAGDHASASAAFRKAIELDPSHAISQVYLAILLGIHGDRDQGLSGLRAAEETMTDNPLLHLKALMAYGYRRLGQQQDAERLVKEIEVMDAHSRMGEGSEMLISLALNDQERALNCLRVAANEVENQIPDVSYHNLMLIIANAFSDDTLEEPLFRAARKLVDESLEAG